MILEYQVQICSINSREEHGRHPRYIIYARYACRQQHDDSIYKMRCTTSSTSNACWTSHAAMANNTWRSSRSEINGRLTNLDVGCNGGSLQGGVQEHLCSTRYLQVSVGGDLLSKHPSVFGSSACCAKRMDRSLLLAHPIYQ